MGFAPHDPGVANAARSQRSYQTGRLAEKTGPKPIHDEVLLRSRLCGGQGDLIRAKSRREKAMKLATPPS